MWGRGGAGSIMEIRLAKFWTRSLENPLAFLLESVLCISPQILIKYSEE